LGVRDIRNFMGVGKRKAEDRKVMEKRVKVADKHVAATPTPTSTTTAIAATATATTTSPPANEFPTNPKPTSSKSTVFAGTTVYINGSTLPQISDHKLKHLLTSHGARVSSFMARKSVSHVIIGQPGSTSAGAGGGLSARKLQLEIERGGWKGVRVVGVDWYA
jgi:NAD-dependent DNA ligase